MLQELKEGYVQTETHQGITTIEFFHPKGNSLPNKNVEALAKEIHFAGSHAETKVIILKSGGDKSFCAGASFDELADMKTEAEATQFFMGFANVINAIRKSSKFVIGRIHGKCVGGGVGITAAVDYAIATAHADIKLSELEMGIGPFVIGPAVERKIGTAAFSALSIDATMWRNSDWAKRKGMFAEVHETVENMDESIFRLANHLSHNSPDAMAEMKKMLWHGTEHWDELLRERAAISGKLALGSFTKKAIEKFRAKV
ncbi:MAG: enoyl-CoA hydratase/isomerase family protein [Ferruginibacter sp.]|uniref:enoyl-CoA hydratase/isomerase family protein n=1 Tax=Ferruginibacter sp. TaxID=1940288 RepID=UPI0026587115|nr:enoyl-CoA hydratase/isomerase family protein [Ferruginibacter sp.]MDB5278821.1 enoyl-CoA hydratase/isomerase family protein [Ferruginibacter sp.]